MLLKFVYFQNTKMSDVFPWRWKTRKKKGNKSVKEQERVGEEERRGFREAGEVGWL